MHLMTIDTINNILLRITMVILSISFISGAAVLYLNTDSQTSARASEVSNLYIETNGISWDTSTCFGDYDDDGFSICDIITKDNTRIILNCPVGWFEVEILNEYECTVILTNPHKSSVQLQLIVEE